MNSRQILREINLDINKWRAIYNVHPNRLFIVLGYEAFSTLVSDQDLQCCYSTKDGRTFIVGIRAIRSPDVNPWRVLVGRAP